MAGKKFTKKAPAGDNGKTGKQEPSMNGDGKRKSIYTHPRSPKE